MKYQLKEFTYRVIKFLLKFGFAFTYRRIIPLGYEKVKKYKPAIFVANHQNTFMDGVVMVYTAGSSNPSILVRADIFKSNWAKAALGLLKLMPIYRKRDGINTLSQNEQIFNQCFDIFSRKGVVGLFPEGNHAFPRRLRPLQKGAARIALQAEEEKNFELNLSIIPVGLQYENHTERWHDVYVQYTDAINLQDYKLVYEENPQQAYKTITDEIKSGISSQMIDIQSEDSLQFYEQVRILMKQVNQQYTNEKEGQEESLVHRENKMIQGLSSHFESHKNEKESLKKRLYDLISEMKKAGINTYFPIKKAHGLLIMIKCLLMAILIPFYLIFKLINAIPSYIIENKVIAGVKDITWHLSLRFAVGAFIYPIFFGLIWIVLALLIDNILAAIIIFSFPLISIIGLEWIHYFKILKNSWLLRKRSDLVLEKEILIQEIKKILN